MKTITLHRIALGVIIVTVATLVLLGTGCVSSLIPSERAKSAALATTDSINSQQALTIQKAVSGSPAPNVTVGGTNNTTYISPGVAVPAGYFGGAVRSENLPAVAGNSYQEMTTVTSGATQRAGSTESQSFMDSLTIPIGVKIALLALGLFLLFAVIAGGIWILKRNSAAAAAAFGAADGFLARKIHETEAALSTESDSRKQSELLARKAELERERGKLGRK